MKTKTEKELENKVKANLIREIKRKYPKGFCYVCGRKSVTIHHLREHIVGKTKSKGKINGEIPLCRRCHDVVEKINLKNKVSKRIKEAKLEGYRKAKEEFGYPCPKCGKIMQHQRQIHSFICECGEKVWYVNRLGDVTINDVRKEFMRKVEKFCEEIKPIIEDECRGTSANCYNLKKAIFKVKDKIFGEVK